MTHWRSKKSSLPTVSSLRGANSGANSRQPSIPGEIGGGVIFTAVFIAPSLIVLCIYFAYLTVVPELVQH